MVTYAPLIYIQSDTGTIKILKQMIVVNTPDENGDYIQRVRALAESEYENLQRIVDTYGRNANQ